jgi:hypothetical protein
MNSPHWVLFDLETGQYGPTSEQYNLLCSYDWHPWHHTAVLPTLPGFLLRVSREAVNRARAKAGLCPRCRPGTLCPAHA